MPPLNPIGIVTTGRKRGPVAEAQRIADRLGLPYVPRQDTSFEDLFDTWQVPAIYVIGEGQRAIETRRGRLIFHEGSAVLRTRPQDPPDPLIETMALQPGDHVLDATLGLAVDALVVARGLKEGTVTGIESHPMLEDLVASGLRDGPFTRKWLREAAGRIHTVRAEHFEYLNKAADGSFDVINFDPMFAETVTKSHNMQRLREFANDTPVTEEVLREAVRVARRCVVVKCRRGCFEGIHWDRWRAAGKNVFYGVLDASR